MLSELIRPHGDQSKIADSTDELSYPDFLDYRDQSHVVHRTCCRRHDLRPPSTLRTRTIVIWGQVVSANYFDVLQVKPILGRAFLPDEDKTIGANQVVVLSHSFWQRRLDSDPNVVGKTVQLNNRAYQVIGVAPEYFVGTKFALSLDFWTPISMAEDLRRNPGILAERGSHWMNVIGRLKPGVSIKQASAEMNAIATRLNQAYPDTRASNTTRRC